VELVSLSVRRYRSIREAEKLPLGQLTVLIGPNNEGKSNILRALVLGMRVLSEVRAVGIMRGQVRSSRPFDSDYQWDRDFPLGLQADNPEGNSVFDFEFSLNQAETTAFAREVRSNLNGTLPIRISFGPRRVLFQVVKRGPGAKALTAKRDEIVAFLSKRLQLQYVPAVRTAEQALAVVRSLVETELAAVESDPEYAAALAKIADIQRPVLDALAATLTEQLSHFLPDVASVAVDVPPEARSTALRRDVRVVVDDGAPTELRQKGDGVQSLAALSLIRHAARHRETGREQILAVEEPEAHLHPEAIHQLKAVLVEIAQNQQVLVTTHCPVLVNRRDIGSNIIVEANKARPARTIREIRDVLGVRTADNLASADLVLIVEGESDRVALQAILGETSAVLRDGFENGRLAVDSLAGGSNLAYKLGQLRDSLCLTHAFLDNDQVGRTAAERASEFGLLSPADQTFAIAFGSGDSEIEDLYDPAVYKDALSARWNADIERGDVARIPRFANRVRRAFEVAGQPFTDTTERQVKMAIAEAVALRPESSLLAGRQGPIETLVRTLERKLSADGSSINPA
jgi:hypothetical protein